MRGDRRGSEQVVETAVDAARACVHEIRFDGPRLSFAETEYPRFGLCLAKGEHHLVFQNLAHGGAKHHVASQVRFAGRFVAIEHHDVARSEVGRRGGLTVRSVSGRTKCKCLTPCPFSSVSVESNRRSVRMLPTSRFSAVVHCQTAANPLASFPELPKRLSRFSRTRKRWNR